MLIDISQLKFTKNVHGIIHVGAHNCEERMNYLLNFHNITDDDIIWIEAYKKKVDKIKSELPTIRIFNECISNKDNENVVFKVTNNIQSSSFLKLKEHLIEHPDIYEIEQIEMKTKCLKTFYDENKFSYDQFNFINLDIQGAELLALHGAKEILNYIEYIYVEVNTKELYENCPLLDEIDNYLKMFGFKRQNLLMTEHGWGDAFYVKNIFDITDNLIIKYGTDNKNIDVTDIVKNNANELGILHIQKTDKERAQIFGDPVFGTIKKIFIINDNDNDNDSDIYIIENNDYAYIDVKNNKLYINQDIPRNF